MEKTVPSCIVHKKGATSLSVDGTGYEADKQGHIEIAQEHLPAAQSHGFALVDGEAHDGEVKIVATGHDPDKSDAANAAAQASDEEELVEDEDVDYSKLKKPELLALAAKREVDVETDANKDAIIAALELDDLLVAAKYDEVTKDDLLAYAEKRGVAVDKKATKDEVIAALVDADKE